MVAALDCGSLQAEREIFFFVFVFLPRAGAIFCCECVMTFTSLDLRYKMAPLFSRCSFQKKNEKEEEEKKIQHHSYIQANMVRSFC